jgi:hypothetical protein
MKDLFPSLGKIGKIKVFWQAALKTLGKTHETKGL